MALPQMSIARKIQAQSILVVAVLSIIAIYLGIVIQRSSVQSDLQHDAVAHQIELLTTQAEKIAARRLINESRQAFIEHRVWLHDLQVSWLNESENSANTAKQGLEKNRGLLQKQAPAVEKLLNTELGPFSEEMLAAVDAYVDNNRVLGNSLVASARRRAALIEGAFEAEQGKLGKEIEQINSELTTANTTVLRAADTVKSANSSLRNAAILGLVTILAMSIFNGIVLSRAISIPLSKLQDTIHNIEARSDLRQRIPVESEDEIGTTARAVNAMLQRFETIIREVIDASARIATSSQQTVARMHHTEENIDKQQSETDLVSSAITQMSYAVQNVTHSAETAADVARQANIAAHDGQTVVNDSAKSIHDVAEDIRSAGEAINRVANDTANIGRVLDVIRGVSDQTNLLALNAAIEAARAGEAGRGFAVVADEVRVLAQRTHKSTQEIRQMIENLQQGAKAAVDEMERGIRQTEHAVQQAAQTRGTFEDIINSVQRISDLNTQIAGAAEEQSQTTESIAKNAINIRDSTATAAETAHETMSACGELANLSTHLQKLVGQFKVG